MSLITPDFGLLFWMTLIFVIVFLILAKFGFPMITDSVAKRSERINDSIAKAKEAEEKLASLAEEQERMLQQARLEQTRILQEASQTRDQIVAQAKEQAAGEAAKMIEAAKVEIAAEREYAIRDIRAQVAAISVEVAGKLVSKDLSEEGGQKALIDRMVEEVSQQHLN